MESGLLTPGTLFYRVFHESPVGMVITTVADGRYVDVNRAFARLLGYTRQEIQSQTFTIMGLNNVEEREMVLNVLKRIRKLGDIPLVLTGRDGRLLTCIASVQLEEIEGDVYFIIMIQDLTARVDAQEALYNSENRFRLFFQSIPLPLLVVEEATFQILDVNAAAAQLYGYSRDEFTRLTIRDLIPVEEWAFFESAVRKNGGSLAGTSIICRQQLKDGVTIDVDVTGYSFLLDGKKVSLCIFQDVTEQRATQSALRASEERLRIVAEVTTDAIWDRDLLTDAVEWSPGLTSLFGYKDHVDRPHNWWIEHVHPDERAAIEASIEDAFVSGDHYWTAEYRFRRADGAYANVLDRGYIVRDRNGQPIRFIGAMVDITDQLQGAEAATRAAMEERQRLARDLHDSVTQSLYSVSLMAEAARRRADAGEHEVTTEFIARLGELTRQALRQLRLLVYELRPGVLEQEGLAGALRHRLEAVEKRAGVRATLIDDSETYIPLQLQGELFWIAQEALNNSLKHASATSVTIHLQAVDGELILEVSDNGLGFDPATAEETGGLATIRRRIMALGGTMELSTHDGNGTTLRATVPLAVGLTDAAD